MRNSILYILLVFFLQLSCKENDSRVAGDLPRIAIAGIGIESSTFSPAVKLFFASSAAV